MLLFRSAESNDATILLFDAIIRGNGANMEPDDAIIFINNYLLFSFNSTIFLETAPAFCIFTIVLDKTIWLLLLFLYLQRFQQRKQPIAF
jgi:hypothetical protein